MRLSHATGSARDALLHWQLLAVAATSSDCCSHYRPSEQARRMRGTARREREPRETTLQFSCRSLKPSNARHWHASCGKASLTYNRNDMGGAAQAETGATRGERH